MTFRKPSGDTNGTSRAGWDRVINLEMDKALKEKGFNDVLPGQNL